MTGEWILRVSGHLSQGVILKGKALTTEYFFRIIQRCWKFAHYYFLKPPSNNFWFKCRYIASAVAPFTVASENPLGLSKILQIAVAIMFSWPEEPEGLFVKLYSKEKRKSYDFY